MSSRPRVILDPYPRPVGEMLAVEELDRLRSFAEVVWARDEPMPLDQFARDLPTAVAVACRRWRYGRLPEGILPLRAIVGTTAAFPIGAGDPAAEALTHEECRKRGVRVLSIAPAFGRQVAEFALALALAACRDVAAGHTAMREGTEHWQHAGNKGCFLLFSKPVGLIGHGGLARALRPLLAPFGCPIAAHDPWLGDGYLRSQGVEPKPLDRLLRESRVIFVLAVPSLENRAQLSRAALEQIQSGSVLVLVSRAHVVDFDALTELVLAGRFKLATDVFPVEPLPRDHPLRRAPGVVLSAHRAGSVAEGLLEIGRMLVDDLEAIVAGLPPRELAQAEPELIGRYAHGGPRATSGSAPAV